ncbi:MAG: thioredoxin domain-containing protein [Bacteroidota bacterium]|jgi:uncharacterized protein YyaL (SSP411 family)
MRLLDEDTEQNKSIHIIASQKKANRLGQEKSPYLLQHALNPVDWYPWGDEAFEKARKEDKPIFLSIGYSTCYWCHVMEREVFENRSIADLMNLLVVSIKVDREERPDIDQIYMTALQAMTGSGGWPMSIFMTPERKPFFAATYIPPTGQSGNPGFLEILERIHKVWTNERSKVLESGERIGQFLASSAAPPLSDKTVTESMLERGFDEFAKSYDATYGGFGHAPKFPRPTVLNFLFRYYHRTGNTAALDMALTTLQKMAEGGIYDRIGGGFHRYSTDERWHVPHFEKMLYDQAQLVLSYLDAFQITHDQMFAQVARKVLEYIQRVLMHPEGGFYSAEDAESAISPFYPEEKKEGAFYIWKKSEIDRFLTKEEAGIVEFIFGIEEEGNVQSDPRQEFVGENIFFVAHSAEEAARHIGAKVEDVAAHLDMAKATLFDKRQQRPRPHLDDKILLSWNGLMISAFARAYQVLRDESYLEDAERASRFLLTRLAHPTTGKLFRRYRDGEAKYDAHLTDYAFFIQGLLDLYEATFQIEWLQKAIKLTEDQIASFYDNERGGFFDSPGTDPTILIRMKEAYDGAEPSGNSISVLNLLRLSQIVGSVRYSDMALKSLVCFGEYIEKIPQALPQFLVAVDFSLSKPMQIVLAGNRKHPVIREMLDEIHSRFLPNKIMLFADAAEGQEFLSRHVPFFGNLSLARGKQMVYICENYTCELPTSDVETMIQILEKIDRKKNIV